MILFIASLILIPLCSHIAGKTAELIKLPSLIGIIGLGMLCNLPNIQLLPSLTLTMAPLAKDFALVVVLFIAGLGISWSQLQSIGKPAVLLSILPATIEGFIIALLSVLLLGMSFIQGSILGFIIAAVSPAVLIPAMVDLMKQKRGVAKAIPQMLLVGASADDTVAITFFTIFLNLQIALTNNQTLNVGNDLLFLVVSIVLSIAFAAILAKLWYYFVQIFPRYPFIHFLCALLLAIAPRYLETTYHLTWLNSLLLVMFLGFFIHHFAPQASQSVIRHLQYIWSIAKYYLFFFVGAAINPYLVGQYFPIALLMLTISLGFRSIGVFISLIGTQLTLKERLFCAIAFLPKATVQAAKSGIPLQYNVPMGDVMQAIAITSILITAPLGAIGIQHFAPKYLDKSS